MFCFEIKKDIFEHLKECNASYLSRVSSGENITLLQDYPEECMHFVIRNIIHIINESIMMVIYAVYLWRIGLLSVISAPLSTFINFKFKKRIRNHGEKESKAYQAYMGWLLEKIDSLKEIVFLGAQKKVVRDYYVQEEKILYEAKKTSFSVMNANSVISLINLLIKLCLYSLSAVMVWENTMSVGVLTVILTFYGYLTRNVSSVSQRYLDSENRISYIQKIYDFLHTPTEKVWDGKDNLQVSKGKIEISNLYFSYNDQSITLKNINLISFPGESIALVGKSGCGKTTLAFLMLGFYKLQKGKILIDGKSLNECSLKSIRNQIGLVQQNVLIFSGSIRQNLLLGNIHATEREIWDACKAAGIEELIHSFPEKLDTVVGNNGINLSGGQKQRIAIARIYLKNPKIIIFDEATSALDLETEKEVLRYWKKLFSDKTSIVITHRKEVALACDRVAVMNNGEIVEVESVDKLNQTESAFQKLFTSEEKENA